MSLLLVLGCIFGEGGVLGGGKEGGGPDILPHPDPNAVYYVYRGADGEDMESVSDPAELCGGADFLGILSGASACQESGQHGVLNIISDKKGRIWPDDLDNEADLCPSGWEYRGGNGWTATCVSSQSAHAAMLYYNAAGDYYEDTDKAGDICPSGSTWQGNSYYGAPLCVYDGWGAVLSMANAVDGTAFSEADGNGPEVCGAWEYVGSWYGWAQCRVTEGTVIVLYRNMKEATFDGDNGNRICPDGWDYSGSYYGYALCWSAEKRAQVSLYVGASGKEYSGDLGDVDGICPDGWTAMGDVGGTLVCVQ